MSEQDQMLTTLSALRLMADEWRGLGHNIPIRIDRIVATAWNPGRLEQAKRKLAEGLKAPPIKLVAFRLGATRLYEPSDGIHRTVAAREAGRTHIYAHLSGEQICIPARCAIQGRTFMSFTAEGRANFWQHNLSEVLLVKLAKLGVPSR